MKVLGVVGGIGPESTIAYYRSIIATARKRRSDEGNPPILINSIDVHRVLQLVAEGALTTLINYLVTEVEKLAKGGAALGLLAANTPHVVFDEVAARAPIPLVSIVAALATSIVPTWNAASRPPIRSLTAGG